MILFVTAKTQQEVTGRQECKQYLSIVDKHRGNSQLCNALQTVVYVYDMISRLAWCKSPKT